MHSGRCDFIVIMESWCEANICCNAMLWQGALVRCCDGVDDEMEWCYSWKLLVTYHVKIRRENIGANLDMCARACVHII